MQAIKLALAKNCGVAACINSREQDLADWASNPGKVTKLPAHLSDGIVA